MDASVLKAIINSCEDVAKSAENLEELKELKDEQVCLPSDALVSALCSSLTNLLSYNVSKEAYQRYSVRLHIIEIIRDLVRIRSPFDSLNAFTREENTKTLVERLVSKYLTNENLEQCNCADTLEALARTLTFLAKENKDLVEKAEEVIKKICRLEATDKSRKLLCDIARNHANSIYDQSVIELIFSTQKCELIEEPLLNGYVSSRSELSEINKQNDSEKKETISLDQLLEFVVKSPATFKLISSCMKEMMVHLNYAPTFIEFIKNCLNKIDDMCKSQGKVMLDLYPERAQPVVILLRINPSLHSKSSEENTLKLLKKIYLNDKEDTLVLLSQFPEWLDTFTKFLKTETDKFDIDVHVSE